MNRKSRWGLLSAVFYLWRLSISISQYPDLASIGEMILAPSKTSKYFSTVGRKYKFLHIPALSLQYLTKILNEPSVLCTETIGLSYTLLDGSMISPWSIFLSSLHHAVFYDGLLATGRWKLDVCGWTSVRIEGSPSWFDQGVHPTCSRTSDSACNKSSLWALYLSGMVILFRHSSASHFSSSYVFCSWFFIWSKLSTKDWLCTRWILWYSRKSQMYEEGSSHLSYTIVVGGGNDLAVPLRYEKGSESLVGLRALTLNGLFRSASPILEAVVQSSVRTNPGSSSISTRTLASVATETAPPDHARIFDFLKSRTRRASSFSWSLNPVFYPCLWPLLVGPRPEELVLAWSYRGPSSARDERYSSGTRQ